MYALTNHSHALLVCILKYLVWTVTQNGSNPQLDAGPKNRMNQPPNRALAILATLL